MIISQSLSSQPDFTTKETIDSVQNVLRAIRNDMKRKE